ncbi:hypothetical protein E4T47_04689 [Aureobasidium subglaciale]|nr:hypothetical protein E4T47_04689 [Aureobasidium subglaciale]
MGIAMVALKHNPPLLPLPATAALYNLKCIPLTKNIQPVEGPDFLLSFSPLIHPTSTFLCHCTDCRKITASIFTSAFVIEKTVLKHIRDEHDLTQYSTTVEAGNTMSDFFCKTCGSLMYRQSSQYPDLLVPRTGTIDNLEFPETKLKPQVEVFCRSSVGWFGGLEDVRQMQAGADMS